MDLRNQDQSLSFFPNAQPFEGSEAQELPTGAIDPWAEPYQYYWDGILVDPPMWPAVAPSYPYLPQVLQPPQSPRLPQISPAEFRPNPDRQMAGFPFNETDKIGPGNTGVDVDPNAVERSKTPTESSRKRSEHPAKRRGRNLQKSILFDEIRGVMGMERGTPKLAVLNAAIVEMGGEALSGVSGEGITLAFRRLHELTGSQGELRHVQCLERVIKALKGEPTLDPIFEGRPSGST